MSKDIGLSHEQARQAWTKGYKSAASLCQSVMEELLADARFSHEQQAFLIPQENMDAQLSRVKDGLYNQVRVADKVGLDYYFAQTNPQTILGGKVT